MSLLERDAGAYKRSYILVKGNMLRLRKLIELLVVLVHTNKYIDLPFIRCLFHVRNCFRSGVIRDCIKDIQDRLVRESAAVYFGFKSIKVSVHVH